MKNMTFEFPEERIEGIDSFYVVERFDGVVGSLITCTTDFSEAVGTCSVEAYCDSNYREGIYFVNKYIWSDSINGYDNIGGYDIEGLEECEPESIYAEVIKSNGF